MHELIFFKKKGSTSWTLNFIAGGRWGLELVVEPQLSYSSSTRQLVILKSVTGLTMGLISV